MIEKIGVTFRVLYCHLFINGKVVVEMKNVQTLTEHHAGQLREYMRLLFTSSGLLLNFPRPYPQARVPQAMYHKSSAQHHVEPVFPTSS